MSINTDPKMSSGKGKYSNTIIVSLLFINSANNI